ncbi:MAG: 50S ribosomal protein L17 [Spirochaetales bacterium]|nr:50S ribosomal protein L17 [Spirochaetales bacterium]
MRHKFGFNRLDRKQSHRKAMLRNMVISLFKYERIETTKAKALEVRKAAEKLITRAKSDSVHDRRIVAKDINDKAVLNKLFTEISPMFSKRKGGYTRILKLGFRQGDAAEMVILELVEKTAVPEKTTKKGKGAEDTATAEDTTEKETPEKTPEVIETPEIEETPAEDTAEKTD